MRYYLLPFITIYFFLDAYSQQFRDETKTYNIDHIYGTGTAGGGVSFIDFDNDGFDDISLGSSENNPPYFYKNLNGLTFSKINLLPNFNKEVKSLLWVDFDNDGDKDLFLSTAKDKNYLFENLGNLQLQDITEQAGLPMDTLTSFGACFGDYNRDGWLDLYYGERRIQETSTPNKCYLFRNNGNKTFTDVTISSNTQDDNFKTPFCSSFIDYNNDKWPDIYTAHDRRKGNTMLKNNGNETFTDVSAETQTDLKMDGMSVSIADVNSDGYQDIYVSNTEVGNALFINQDGVRFENQSSQLGCDFLSIAWGTNFLDGDNDGDQDLYVSSMVVGIKDKTSAYFTYQKEKNKFEKLEQVPSDTVSSFNNAVGDFNNDGYSDIIVSNSSFNTKFLLNKGGQNNYIKLKLKGKISNKDGIGSTLTCETIDGNIQHIYTQCGIGFLGQNSDNIIIGIGNNTSVKKLKILWPTGHIDVFSDLAPNVSYTFEEGQSTGGQINIDEEITSQTKSDSQFILPLIANPNNGNIPINIFNDFEDLLIINEEGNVVYRLDKLNQDTTLEINENGYYIAIIKKGNKTFNLRFLVIK